jgi:Straboviridae intron-like DNA endonuclease
MIVNLHIRAYKKVWGNIPKDESGRTFDVHHLDGNRSNNDKWNLIAVPIKIHYLIHKAQGDWKACQTIAIRMKKSPQEISSLASLANKQRVNEGVHHWLGFDYNHREQQRRIAAGTHNFLDREWQQMNAQKIADKKYTCPYCDKVGKGNAMLRWHFDNCKSK